ncbi:MAG: oxidoreductase, partial [Nitratireductor sp.]|nr:oxidoreductase [Nitratireductor sp.]
DGMNRDALIEATRGADIIFNGLNPPYTDWHDRALPMAENTLAAASAHGALHLFPGNVYPYGSKLPPLLTPDTPLRPDHAKARIRADMQHRFEAAARRGAVQTVVLRAGDFFGGTGTGSWFDLVLSEKLDSDRFTWPGNPKIDHAWAYLPDLAQAFVRLAAHQDDLPMFSSFTFAGHTASGEAMQRATERAVGRRLRRRALPGFLVSIAGWVQPKMREVSEVFYLWHRPHRLDGSALEAVTGPLPHTPLDEAVRQALAELGRLPEAAAGAPALRAIAA